MNKFDGCHTIFTSLIPLPRPVRQVHKKPLQADRRQR